jgi:hypothetical protein
MLFAKKVKKNIQAQKKPGYIWATRLLLVVISFPTLPVQLFLRSPGAALESV